MDTIAPAWTLSILQGLRYTMTIAEHVITVYKRKGLYQFRIDHAIKDSQKLYLCWDSIADMHFRGSVNPHIVQEHALAKLARILE